jgi:hypothetical protein
MNNKSEVKDCSFYGYDSNKILILYKDKSYNIIDLYTTNTSDDYHTHLVMLSAMFFDGYLEAPFKEYKDGCSNEAITYHVVRIAKMGE